MIKKKISSKPDKKFVLYDMCCGVGVYSILFSKYFDECIGVDCNPNNIKIANKIKSINNTTNVKFYEGKIENIMKKLVENDNREKLYIINPARSGIPDSIIDFMNNMGSNKNVIVILCSFKSLIYSFTHITIPLKFKIEMFPLTNNKEYILQT